MTGKRRGKRFNAWLDLEWEEDAFARALVAENPDGQTLDQIGEYLGLTRERVRQIEQGAILKLRDPELGEAVLDFEGFAFAVRSCSSCGFDFIRATGRQLYCRRCSRGLEGKVKVYELAPGRAADAARMRCAAARYATARLGGLAPSPDPASAAEPRGPRATPPLPAPLPPEDLCSHPYCSKAGRLKHGGNPYCGLHHPERVAARRGPPGPDGIPRRMRIRIAG